MPTPDGCNSILCGVCHGSNQYPFGAHDRANEGPEEVNESVQ